MQEIVKRSMPQCRYHYFTPLRQTDSTSCRTIVASDLFHSIYGLEGLFNLLRQTNPKGGPTTKVPPRFMKASQDHHTIEPLKAIKQYLKDFQEWKQTLPEAQRNSLEAEARELESQVNRYEEYADSERITERGSWHNQPRNKWMNRFNEFSYGLLMKERLLEEVKKKYGNNANPLYQSQMNESSTASSQNFKIDPSNPHWSPAFEKLGDQYWIPGVGVLSSPTPVAMTLVEAEKHCKQLGAFVEVPNNDDWIRIVQGIGSLQKRTDFAGKERWVMGPYSSGTFSSFKNLVLWSRSAHPQIKSHFAFDSGYGFLHHVETYALHAVCFAPEVK